MKKVLFSILVILTIVGVVCCVKETHIDGEPAAIGEVGTEVRLGNEGFSNVDISIVDCTNGEPEITRVGKGKLVS